MENLLKTLEKYILVTDILAQNILNKSEQCRFKARTKLLHPGQKQDSLYYLSNGIIRNYYKSEEKEWTSRFCQQGDFVMSLDNFFFNLPCKEFIETCTDVSVIKLAKQDYLDLLAQFPELHIASHKIADERLLMTANRMYSWRMLSAAERYHSFVRQFPELYKQVQLQHIASYLDISRFSLSRIRKQSVTRPDC